MTRIKKVPMRVCTGCREKRPKKELVRVVRSPEGEVLLDSTGKKAGRGAYICSREECFRNAVKGKRLDRNLQITVPAEVINEIAALLRMKESEI